MKTTNPMAALFGKSPFKPIQAHMRVVMECVSEVPALFQALVDGDQSKLEAQKNLIFEKEQAADEIKNQLRGQLPKSLLMPVDRRDLLEVLDLQDPAPLENPGQPGEGIKRRGARTGRGHTRVRP